MPCVENALIAVGVVAEIQTDVVSQIDGLIHAVQHRARRGDALAGRLQQSAACTEYPRVAERRPVDTDRGGIRGEYYAGHWEDVGTPERLEALDAALRSSRD